MILVNAEHQIDIELIESENVSIIIENKKEFAKITEELWNQISGKEGDFLISDNKKNYNLSKCADIIFNPFAIDLNSKKVLNAFYSRASSIGNEYEVEKSEYLGASIRLLDVIADSVNYAGLKYNYDIDWVGFFKSFEFEFQNDVDYFDRIVEYIKVVAEFTDIKLLFFVNLRMYIDDMKLNELYKVANAYKIWCIDLENCVFSKVEDEKQFVIDNDLCIIKI